MNRQIFEKRMNEDVPNYSNEDCSHIIRDSLAPLSINKNGTQNLVIVAEEFMEAGIEITKYLRGNNNILGLTEELADAYLCIKYAQEICGISDETLKKAINIKLERQHERNMKSN